MANFLSNRQLRSLHRDIGYFFVGLIIAFAISGIAQNHRKQWKPDRYTYEFKKVSTHFHLPKESVTKDSIKAFSAANGLPDLKQFDFRKDSSLVIAYEGADATIKLKNGEAEINLWKKKPVLAQMTFLHKFNGNNWWIGYSDIFALGMIFIAASGMFLMKGKNSFIKRGWFFAVAGIIFPLIALFLYY